MWLGYQSWKALYHEIHGLLKALELLTGTMQASKEGLDAPFSGTPIALSFMTVVAGEIALWYTKGPPDEE